jgi:hypothetical protein
MYLQLYIQKLVGVYIYTYIYMHKCTSGINIRKKATTKDKNELKNVTEEIVINDHFYDNDIDLSPLQIQKAGK